MITAPEGANTFKGRNTPINMRMGKLELVTKAGHIMEFWKTEDLGTEEPFPGPFAVPGSCLWKS